MITTKQRVLLIAELCLAFSLLSLLFLFPPLYHTYFSRQMHAYHQQLETYSFPKKETDELKRHWETLTTQHITPRTWSNYGHDLVHLLKECEAPFWCLTLLMLASPFLLFFRIPLAKWTLFLLPLSSYFLLTTLPTRDPTPHDPLFPAEQTLYPYLKTPLTLSADWKSQHQALDTAYQHYLQDLFQVDSFTEAKHYKKLKQFLDLSPTPSLSFLLHPLILSLVFIWHIILLLLYFIR